MKLKEIISLLIETDKRPYYTFERIVLTLLEKHFNEQNKETLVGVRFPDYNIEADGLIVSSASANESSTIVEIKFARTKSLMFQRQILTRFAERTKGLHDKFNFLIILAVDFTKPEKQKTTLHLREKYPEMKFEIWDINDLSPIFNKYVEYVSDLIPQTGTKALKNIVDKSLQFKDWRKEREKLIERLSEAHKKDDLTLFIGAGVSASAGLPDWNSLLSQLLVSLISKNLPQNLDVSASDKLILAKSLQQLNVSSPLLEARYVNSGLGDNFEKEVAEVLYGTVNAETTSVLIKSIANLCIPPRGALGVRALVTYNFDDLIEKELERLGLKYRPIYRDVDIPSKQELGLFHVHGFLPQETNSYDGISESLLVFSEKNYHTLMQDPYFWSNLIQLNFFRENTCLLIGLSGTDPNLRRLLEIAKRKTKFAKHYILLKRTPNKFFIDNFNEQNIAYNDTLIDAINSIHHNLHERSFDELGLNVLWYENHDDIPGILNAINEKR